MDESNLLIAGLDRNAALRAQLPRQLAERMQIMVFADPFELVETVCFVDEMAGKAWETTVVAGDPVDENFIAYMALGFD